MPTFHDLNIVLGVLDWIFIYKHFLTLSYLPPNNTFQLAKTGYYAITEQRGYTFHTALSHSLPTITTSDGVLTQQGTETLRCEDNLEENMSINSGVFVLF